MLDELRAQKKGAWEDYLQFCVFAYNTFTHGSSKSPYELMFGRKPVLPINYHLQMDNIKDLDQAGTCLQHASCIPLHFITIFIGETEVNMLEKAKAIVYAFNPECFEVDALVLKKDFTRRKRKGGKLDEEWDGPYRVLRVLGRGLYRLENVADPKKVIPRVKGVHLKKYPVQF